MKPFLKQVAEHYSLSDDTQKLCFIFPNRRSLVFFTRYLSECNIGRKKPFFLPEMLTVNDFFFRVTGMKSSDRVNLLLCLYDCYKRLYSKAEDLDDFIFWGDVILADFDDVDKYLVDPRALFTNVSDFKSIKDTWSYLSDTQRRAIEEFLRHFRQEGRLVVNPGAEKPNAKESFLQIWDILHPLYTAFNQALSEKGQAYEGQAYRTLATRLDAESATDILSGEFPDTEKYVFVGLNALNECEKKVLRKMRDAGIAEFCWDYGSNMIRDRRNKSSYFMENNVREFPQAWEIDESLPETVFNVVSVPSAVGQAKLLPSIFQASGATGIDTAVILPDENLLVPVLNSIPENIRDINVTMGYPMCGSEFYSLLNEIATMQLHLRCKDGRWFFYHKQVRAIFSNSIFRAATGEAGLKLSAKVKSAAKYYIPQKDLADIPVCELIFSPVVLDAKSADASAIHSIEDYQSAVIRALAPALKDDPDMAMELEFARDYYLAVNRLRRMDIPVLPATYFRLLTRLLGPVSVPFKGEPLKGLQIMGPLETRALDFDKLVILSCNEGVFPHRSISTSFIPPELRRGFGLPTYEFQDAVWAYYFYRMIQRAGTVWMLCDSRTENMKSGEESRYIKQLEMHYKVKVNRFVAKSLISAQPEAGDIDKTAADIEELRNSLLSATALQKYLFCPAQFYYHKVKNLKSDDEVTESLDSGMIGDVFHLTMQDLYKGHKTVSQTDLESCLHDGGRIRTIIRNHIKDKLHTIEVAGRNLIFEDVIFQYVKKVIERDIEYLRTMGADRFSVHGIECVYWLDIHGFHFYGKIDRLDSLKPGTVRIVDYKTGKVEDADIHISDDNAQEVVDSLFGPDNAKRPKIALQLYLYDLFVNSDSNLKGLRRFNSIYQTSKLFVAPVEDVEVSGEFCRLMEERISSLLDEISDPQVKWRRTDDTSVCQWCDFKMLCGR